MDNQCNSCPWCLYIAPEIRNPSHHNGDCLPRQESPLQQVSMRNMQIIPYPSRDSCIRIIEESLYCLSPKPSSVDISIDRKYVRIIHDPALQVPMLQHSLLNAGFDIQVEYSGTSNGTNNYHNADVLHGTSGAHEQYCCSCSKKGDMLHEDLYRGEADVSSAASRTLTNQAATPDRYRLTLAIGGMTCASCTRSITEALTSMPGVHQVSVNLIENSGTCILDDEKLAELMRDTIDDCGFEARVVRMDPESRNMSETVKTLIRTVALKIDGISTPSVYPYFSPLSI